MKLALFALVLAAGAVSAAEPSRQYLWVLSRTPALSPEDRRATEARLPAHGYDAARLVDSPPER
jgi:apolipoprotein D and lipocalin family protein